MESEQLSLFDLGVDMRRLLAERDRVARGASAANTLRALETDWGLFERWCESVGRRALPASEETVQLHCIDVVRNWGLKVATVRRRLWAVTKTHVGAGHRSPVGADLRRIVAGLARQVGTAVSRKDALTVPELRLMVSTLDGRKFAGARDRSLLLLGFSTGIRGAELAALDLGDVRITRRGLAVTLRRSKTDQEGEGRSIGVMRGAGQLDAVAAVEQWLRKRGGAPGPLFGVCSKWPWSVVKAAAAAAGLDATRFGAHSLRAGMITELDRRGVSLPAIMARSGHKSYDVVVRYVRHRDEFLNDPLAPRASAR